MGYNLHCQARIHIHIRVVAHARIHIHLRVVAHGSLDGFSVFGIAHDNPVLLATHEKINQIKVE